MRAILAVLAIFLQLCVGALAWTHGNGGAAQGWFPLDVGGGGFATGLDFQSDGTKLAHTNSGGAYKWNGSAWVQLVDNTLPSAVWANFGTMGVQELVAAPSATSTFYMKFNGFMLSSTTSGASGSWVNRTSGWAQDNYDNSNSGPGTGSQGPQIAVDPANANVVFAGNNSLGSTSGVLTTTNGGGTFSSSLNPQAVFTGSMTGGVLTVTAVSSGTIYVGGWVGGAGLGTGQNTPTILGFLTGSGGTGTYSVSQNYTASSEAMTVTAQFYAIAFDPHSSVVGGKTQGIYACVYSFGCYHSTDGGATWPSIISGGPTQVLHIMVDVNGNLWVADLTVWKYNGSSWSHSITTADQNGYYSVAVDPNTSGAATEHVFAVTSAGNLNASLNTGTSWSGVFPSGPTVSASDVPWLAATAQGFLTAGQIIFDPAGSAPFNLYSAAGTGVFHLVPPTSNVTSTQLTWISQTAGQETLVGNVMLTPTGGSVLPSFYVWDRMCFRITNKDAYSNAQTCFPAASPIAVWSADYAGGTPATIVELSSAFGGGNDTSGLSTDGAQTWAQFAAKPAFAGTWPNGSIAAGSSTQFMWIRGDGGTSPGAYTSNSGASWGSVTGLPTTFSNALLVADKVTANTFYAYNNNSGTGPGVYSCTGATCSKVHTGSLGNNGMSMYSVPGKAGHLFFSDTFDKVIFSIDGGATWSSALSNGPSTFQTITAVGFGAVWPGQSYPSIYMVGLDAAGTYGVWRCKDFNSSTGAGTWTNLGAPLNKFITISSVAGDQTIPQLVYLATGGNGAVYGYFNFLLKRDIDPAANDNGPMWLNEAA